VAKKIKATNARIKAQSIRALVANKELQKIKATNMADWMLRFPQQIKRNHSNQLLMTKRYLHL